MEILTYAKENRLQFYGFAYEKGINELVIDTFDDYITQIEIPIKHNNIVSCSSSSLMGFTVHTKCSKNANCRRRRISAAAETIGTIQSG